MNVRPTLAGWYLGLSGAQCIAAIAFVVWYEAQTIAEDGLPKTILEIAQGLVPFFFIALTGSLLIVEGAAMLAERYLRERYNKGREEGLEEGREEGREEGLEEGREEGPRRGAPGVVGVESAAGAGREGRPGVHRTASVAIQV